MALTALVPAIITGIINLVKDPIKRHQELKQAKHIAKVERIKSGDDHAAGLDRLSIQQRGWKDDYLLLLSTSPLLAIFIDPLVSADLASAISASFKTLNEMPEYYWYVLALIYIDTFGFRRMLRVAVERWLDNKFNTTKGSS